MVPSILAPLNAYSGVPQIPTAGSQLYTVYAECYSGVSRIYSIAKQSTMPTAPLQSKLRSKLATTQVYTVYHYGYYSV